MRLGPDQIVTCPHCEALAWHFTLLSGNTIGARTWTDGKQIARMLPRLPPVVKCHHCQKCYWLADARKVGTVELLSHARGQVDPAWAAAPQLREPTEEVDPAWAAAPEVQEPTEEDYYQVLQEGLASDSQQERSLRILAWWRRNDAFRRTTRAEVGSSAPVTGECRANLEALVSLLDEADENDRIMKAEVLRELGEFESARLVLSRVTSAEYTMVVRQLDMLCASEDASVKELEFGG